MGRCTSSGASISTMRTATRNCCWPVGCIMADISAPCRCSQPSRKWRGIWNPHKIGHADFGSVCGCRSATLLENDGAGRQYCHERSARSILSRREELFLEDGSGVQKPCCNTISQTGNCLLGETSGRTRHVPKPPVHGKPLSRANALKSTGSKRFSSECVGRIQLVGVYEGRHERLAHNAISSDTLFARNQCRAVPRNSLTP